LTCRARATSVPGPAPSPFFAAKGDARTMALATMPVPGLPPPEPGSDSKTRLGGLSSQAIRRCISPASGWAGAAARECGLAFSMPRPVPDSDGSKWLYLGPAMPRESGRVHRLGGWDGGIPTRSFFDLSFAETGASWSCNLNSSWCLGSKRHPGRTPQSTRKADRPSRRALRSIHRQEPAEPAYTVLRNRTL